LILPHRVKDPKAAEIIATLSDIRFLSSNRYQMKDMGGLMDLCDQSNKAVMSYVMFDVKSVINPQSDPQQMAARLAPLMEKNVRTFQNELGELQPFLFRCLAKEIPLLTEFAQASILRPEARKQLAELAASSKVNASPLLRDNLQGIVTGMSDPRCEGLCAL
jgi:hypothetical protein